MIHTSTTHEKIRVYVGTYHKYNCGSSDGGWLTINDYKDESEFWAAARKLHYDERDPEFMFPDYELPDFIGHAISESHIDFDVIFDYLRNPVPVEEVTPVGNLKKEDIAEGKRKIVELLASSWSNKEHWRKYYEKSVLYGVTLSDGLMYRVDKPSLKTSFCFGYGCNGADFDDDYKRAAAAEAEMNKFECFLDANTEELTKCINGIKNRDTAYGREPYICIGDNGIATIDWSYIPGTNWWGHPIADGTWRALTDDDIARITAGLQLAVDNIKRRCKTWWKKFGPSKLNTWTYLRD